MYPVQLGFSEAKKRINVLLDNGHDAEALLTTTFTLEKVIRRTLKQLVISAGFRSVDAKKLLSKIQGFQNQRQIWSCFDPKNRNLFDVVQSEHWQHLNTAVTMRNQLVHGSRVYNLSVCRETALQTINLLDDVVARFKDEYGYDGWSQVRRRISRLHIDPKVKV